MIKKVLYCQVKCPECGRIEQLPQPEHIAVEYYYCYGCCQIISAKKTGCIFCEYSENVCPIKHEIKAPQQTKNRLLQKKSCR